VHRAGYDKDGNKVDLKKEDVVTLANQATDLVHEIETVLINMPIGGNSFWKT
jgi:hypothetical protein